MAAQVLISELSTLAHDSKRKNSDLKNASEKSLQDLKSLANTSEAGLTADLCRRPYFVTPFLIACNTRNAKFANCGITCLQRLAITRALPKSRIREVLDSLKECGSLGYDTQLKILQILPQLLQQYPDETNGDPFARSLQLCSALSSSKATAVSGTASATLQQLVVTAFDRVAEEDKTELEIPALNEIVCDDGPVLVRSGAYDAYRIIKDLCSVLQGGDTAFAHLETVNRMIGLEIIESVLANHAQLIVKHREFIQIVRYHVMPMVNNALSDKLSFPLTMRTMRIFTIVLQNLLGLLPSECEAALSLLNQVLDTDTGTMWKRVLCLEVMRGVYFDPGLAFAIYAQYDETEERKPIIKDNIAEFVRIAAEVSMTASTRQQSAASTSSLVSSKFENLSQNDRLSSTDTPTTGVQSSSVRTACLEQLEKVDQPAISDGYMYYLILACMTGLSESMARFILPLTVINEDKPKKDKNKDEVAAERTNDNYQEDSAQIQSQNISQPTISSYRRKTTPLNPLSLKSHKSYRRIKSVATLINECWPGILATCSTFLTASLDVNNYRALVRSMQKFTQVAGLLRLETPRDAFLTTLGKSAVPSNVLTATVSSPTASAVESGEGISSTKGLLSGESLVNQTDILNSERKGRPSTDTGLIALTPRNMLCLRALLNLAIALGPILGNAWSIVIEILQQSDIITAALAAKSVTNNSHNPSETLSMYSSTVHALNSEMEAVQAATYRLFESTADFPNDAFVDVLNALRSLLHGDFSVHKRDQTSSARRVGSISGLLTTAETDTQDYLFALGKIGDIATINVKRLTSSRPKDSGWDILSGELISLMGNATIIGSARRMAAGILSRLIIDIASAARNEASDRQDATHIRLLQALSKTIHTLDLKKLKHISADETSNDIHVICLEALKSMLERCGDVLSNAWMLVIAIISSVFNQGNNSEVAAEHEHDKLMRKPQLILDATSPSACRTAFEAVELLCADFLSSVPQELFVKLIDALTLFSQQKYDFNISLTSITHMWKLSDLLKDRIDATLLTQKCVEVLSAPNHPDLVHNVANEPSIPALWIYLLLNLSEIAVDNRAEVRNGSVQTTLRIFDNYANLISPLVWTYSIRSVFIRIVELNYEMQIESREARSANGQESINTNKVNETSNIILSGWSHLIGKHINTIASGEYFKDSWDRIIQKLHSFIKLHDYDLNTSSYAFLVEILSCSNRPSVLKDECVLAVKDLWTRDIPKGQATYSRNRSDHESVITYLKLWKEFYRLLSPQQNLSSLKTVATNIHKCIETTNDLAYIPDLDRMTELQSEVVSCMSLLRTQEHGTEIVIDLLARFSTIYLKKASTTDPSGKGTTCVALASSCIDILQHAITELVDHASLFQTGVINVVLENLATNIEWKYKWTLQGKSNLWQKSTLAAISILESILPKVDNYSISTEHFNFMWKGIIRISTSISHAHLNHAKSHTPIKDDELFDLEALTKLRALIIPSLGSAAVSDDIRQDYAHGLFLSSSMHKPLIDEAPESSKEPLYNLYAVRLGNTIETMPSPRMRISYYCLSELFSLVSFVDGSPERVRLAQATAPFLILRAALPIKSYLADQPLRGRTPQPWAQRQELLFLLKQLRNLESESKAIPDTEAVRSAGKKHLFRLFPLLIRAIGIAEKDAQLLEEFRQTLESIEDDFNL